MMRAVMQRGWDRAHDPRISGGHELILTILERHQVLAYGARALTARVIAAQGRCTTRTVRRRMADLEAWGYVDIREHRRRNGAQGANSYQVRRRKGVTPADVLTRRRARAERDRYRKGGFNPMTGEIEPCPPAPEKCVPPPAGGGLTFEATPTRERVHPPYGVGEHSGVDAHPGRVRPTGGASSTAGEAGEQERRLEAHSKRIANRGQDGGAGRDGGSP